jgi:macrolide transport system ATP-binding/permease protein
MLEIRDIEKSYRMGDNLVYALRGVSLTIEDGDFVAIMGPSGSGKSTLMHILGLLDVPSSGSYRVDGRETANLSEDELAVLRREAIGFIFQQFNLLPRMTATENVALPLLYSKRENGIEGSLALLERVGLGTRSFHRPNELSGGQQQRVAIARSLVNQPRMILADEPTGNLDSASESEILGILEELNSQGITVIIVTHEEEVGRRAKRLIRMRDGVVQSDERLASKATVKAPSPFPTPAGRKEEERSLRNGFGLLDLLEHFRQGFKTLAANKVRTGLSMLGILIGVAAVVAMLALGQGAQKAIESQLSSLGSNLLVLRTGSKKVGGVSQGAGMVARLTLEDHQALREQVPEIKASSPSVGGKIQVTYENQNWNTQVQGVTNSYAAMHASEPTTGRFFTDEEGQRRARVAVIGATIVREVFGGKNPIGEMFKLNKVIFQVIGVLPEKGASGWRDQDDIILIPVQTAMYRLLGKLYVDNIELEIRNASDMDAAQERTLDLMYTMHRVPVAERESAYEVRNMADLQAALSESSKTMSALLASIAAISLLVGGIGIMNIMLVSVTERTREIGLRKAIGARRADILYQFLAESVVVSAFGGIAGILLGWIITVVLSSVSGWTTSISPASVTLAFAFSAGIGMVFGIYPAKKASELHPIDALRYE